MSDDLDDLLRRAMKTLGDQVPPGYFEDFPSRTLARLEDGSMHDEPEDALAASSSSDLSPAGTPAAPVTVAGAAAPAAAEPAPPAPPARPRDEDSGLHDIRNLASSQRMRIKRTSQSSMRADDELLATASGSWKAVALPEPAMMVALPELADLPPASEVKEPDRAARREAKQKPAEPRAAAVAAASSKDAGRAREAASAVEQPAQVTPITAAKARPKAAAPSSGKRNAVLAAAGLGLAAAAGAVIFVSTQSRKSDDAARESPSPVGQSSMQLPELRRVEPPRPAAIAAPDPAATAGPAPATATPAEQAADKGKATDVAPEKPGKSMGKYVPNVVDSPKAPDKKDDAKKKPEPGDPDFEKLLKESGYQEKKAEAPKLERKSLSGEDIKKGMNAVTPKVSSCYAGQQGTASVRLTVAPTGQVQKVTVSGVFAGTPVGACVEGAVQLATFPPWDGGPQSINYSYLIAE